MRGPMAGACVAFASLMGCSVSRVALLAPAVVPNYAIDANASELHVVNGTGAEELKRVAVEALQSMVGGRGGVATPARFSAILTASQSFYAVALLCDVLLLPTLFGPPVFCPNTQFEADVEVDLQVGQGHLVGKGSASAVFGAYRSTSDDDRWTSIVHNAFQDALAHAAPSEASHR
jgi:hypothetical protein